MSERVRSYFSLRYALPGYTFITIIFLMNIKYLINTIVDNSYSTDLLSSILGLIASGSAIGFIVSQPWYLYFNFFMKCPDQLLNRRAHKTLNNIYPIQKLICKKHESEDRISIMAYILTHKIPKEITIYINRLNDMINSLASTISAILLGLISGYIVRGIIFKHGLLEYNYECTYDLIIWGASLWFTVLLYCNCRKIFNEHEAITNLMIRLKSEEIKKHFLKLYTREQNDITCERRLPS